MEINKKRTSVVFLIIILLMLALSIGSYYLFMNAFEKDYITKRVNASQVIVNKTTNEKFNDILFLFAEESANNSLSELNLMLEEDSPFSQFGFLEFIKITNNTFTYSNEVVNIEKSYLKEYGFGFFNKSFYVFNDDVAGVVDLNVLLEQAFSFTKANDVLFMSNQGEIYFNLKTDLYKNVLYDYLPEDTGIYFTEYFSLNKEVLIKTKIAGVNGVVNFIPLESFNNLYIAEQYFTKDIQADFFSLNLFLAALFGAMAVLSIGVLLVIYHLLNKKNADIETKKYEYYYTKPYIVKINKKGKIKTFNKRIKEDLSEEFKKGKNINDVFTFEDVLLEKIGRGAPLIYKEGERNISFLPLKYARGYYLIGEHLSSSIAGDDEVYRLAYYNDITGLPNLHLFHNDVEEKLSLLSPFEEEELYFVGFKLIGVEKSFGKISDYVKVLALKEITKDLKGLIKHNNSKLYNTTEDEFVAVLKEKTFKDVEALVLKVINHFEKPIVIAKSKLDFNVRASIVSVSGKESSSKDSKTIYSHVNETLKRAVGSTHQKYVIFDDTITHYLTERQLMEQELKLAIDHKEFVPYLQAQYNYKEDRIEGFEALIRWDNPNYITRSPQNFIELAEETGLINEIGKIMTEKTFELAKKLESYDVKISLNVSPIEILRQGFVEEFLALHKKHKLRPGSITLEITETTLLQSYRVINEKIKVLKRNGIKIDLDDFGTGYSSLPYIKELDFDTIKIDKTFVDYIETDKYNKAIVQMIISLAKTLNANVVAEGVETEKQMNYLVRAGCNVIQGYYISKPLPYLEAKQLIEDYNVNKTKSFQKKGGK